RCQEIGEEPAGAQQVTLADELVHGARTHALGERCGGVRTTFDWRPGGEQLGLPGHQTACSTGVSAWHPWGTRGRSETRQGAVMGRIRTVGLVVKRNRPRAARLAARMQTMLRRRGLRVL